MKGAKAQAHRIGQGQQPEDLHVGTQRMCVFTNWLERPKLPKHHVCRSRRWINDVFLLLYLNSHEIGSVHSLDQ